MLEQQTQQAPSGNPGGSSFDYTPPEQAQQGTAVGEQAQQSQQQPVQTQGNQQTLSQEALQQPAEQTYSHEQYANLQSAFTRTSQQLSQLQNRYNGLLETTWTQSQQQQQPQQQQAPSLWEMNPDQLSKALETDFKGTLSKLIDSRAQELVQERVNPLTQTVQAQQLLINTERVDQTMNHLATRYGHLPQFQEVLHKAVDWVTGPGRAIAKENPAQAITNQFRTELYTMMENNPGMMAQLQQHTMQQNQQQNLQKQIAAPMTTSGNVQQQPHAPMQQQQMQQGPSPQQMARQIAQYGEEWEHQGRTPFKQVQINDYS